jgi:membrane protease YdiL (CAAX protease family)
MNKNPESKQFWRLCGPILLFWLIEIIARFMIEIIVLIPYLGEIIDESLLSGRMTQSEIMNFALQNTEKVGEILQRYQVEIVGMTALLTVPLTITLFFMDRKKEKLLLLPQNKKAGFSAYIGVVILGAAVCIGVNSLSIMTNLAFVSNKYQEVSNTFYSASIPVQFIFLGLIIPVTEELMFRGVMFKRYRENNNFIRAALYSSLLFGITHGNVVQFIYSFLLGIFLAYVYEKCGSFKAPVIMHVTANMLSLALSAAGVFSWLSARPVRMGAAAVISAFLGSVVFVFIQKIDERPNGMEPPKEDKVTPDMFR